MMLRVRIARWLAPSAFYALEKEAKRAHALAAELVILKKQLDLTERVRDNYARSVEAAGGQLERLFSAAYGRLSERDREWARLQFGLPLLNVFKSDELGAPSPEWIFKHPELKDAFAPRQGETQMQAYERIALALYRALGLDDYERKP